VPDGEPDACFEAIGEVADDALRIAREVTEHPGEDDAELPDDETAWDETEEGEDADIADEEAEDPDADVFEDAPEDEEYLGDEGEEDAEEDEEEWHDPSALDFEEKTWLAGFLTSKHVPAGTMDFETFDGYLTALIAISGHLAEESYQRQLWNGRRPAYDSDEQAAFVELLLRRHAAAIANRFAADQAPEPFYLPTPPAEHAARWIDGFALGMEPNKRAWLRLFRDKELAEVIEPLGAVLADAGGAPRDRLDLEERLDYISLMPVAVLLAHLQHGRTAAPAPVRVAKVGRNAPCPCGSGKKFKKCCGA
jgi:uncharacterized protein